MIEVIPLKSGKTFKRVFSNPEVFCQFAQDVLGIQLQIDQVHTEYEYPHPVGFVKSKYDLFAEDTVNRIVVEIQQVKEPDFFDRFLYYHLISLVEEVKGFKAYGFDRTVYTIVVLTSIPRDGSIDFSCAVSDFSPVSEYGRKVPIYPHRLVFLAPRLANAETPPTIRKWLDFIADSLDGEMNEGLYPDQLFQQMITNIRQQNISPEELAEIKDEAAWELATELFTAEGLERGIEMGMEQGIEKGIAKGIEKGIAKGIEQGREQGIEQGVAKGIQKMLRALSKRGLSLEQIAEMTELTEAEIITHLDQVDD